MASNDGNWNDVATWMGGIVPSSSNDVVLVPFGITVTFNVQMTSSIKSLGLKGSLIFDPSISCSMMVGTIMVYMGGSITMNPSSRLTEHQVTFIGNANLTEDPGQVSISSILNNFNISIL